MPTAPISERRVKNGAVELHVLSSIARGARLAVAIVPGLSESAEDWRFALEGLWPISAASVSLRGRGASSAPAIGYSLLDHCSDIVAFVESIAVQKAVVVAFSRSVSYALEYAIRKPPKLAGLVLLDYPPRHTALPAGWAAAMGESSWRGRRVGSVVGQAVLGAIADESEAKNFSGLLQQVLVPTLIVRGGAAGAALSANDAAVYEVSMPNCSVAKLQGASHALWEPDPQALVAIVKEFVTEVERGET